MASLARPQDSRPLCTPVSVHGHSNVILLGNGIKSTLVFNSDDPFDFKLTAWLAVKTDRLPVRV